MLGWPQVPIKPFIINNPPLEPRSATLCAETGHSVSAPPRRKRRGLVARTCDCAQARPVDLGELWRCTHAPERQGHHLRGGDAARRTIRIFSPAGLVRSRHGERVQLACVRHCEASTDGRACLSRASAHKPRQAEDSIRGGRTYVRDRLPRRHRHERLHLL